ncbi:hypothetical protein B5S32_g2592 [[Candida] boidinii]|nr:hypothetical protein B5S32_g2592 [[Candida] boidinii]
MENYNQITTKVEAILSELNENETNEGNQKTDLLCFSSFQFNGDKQDIKKQLAFFINSKTKLTKFFNCFLQILNEPKKIAIKSKNLEIELIKISKTVDWWILKLSFNTYSDVLISLLITTLHFKNQFNNFESCILTSKFININRKLINYSEIQLKTTFTLNEPLISDIVSRFQSADSTGLTYFIIHELTSDYTESDYLQIKERRLPSQLTLLPEQLDTYSIRQDNNPLDESIKSDSKENQTELPNIIPKLTVKTLSLHKKEVSYLIGRKGKSIESIRSKSQAKIQILDIDNNSILSNYPDNNNNCEFTNNIVTLDLIKQIIIVKGTPIQIQVAEKLINERLFLYTMGIESLR